MIRVVNISSQVSRAREGVGRAFAFSAGRPSPFGRLVAMMVFLVVAALAVIILVPLVLLALVGGLAFYSYIRLRAWMALARQPNGPLDGRKNVRVRPAGPD